MEGLRETALTEPEVRAALDSVLAASRFEALSAGARGLRTVPAGKKSEATFDHIVTTAAEVLDDVPLRDITTHLIADRADVNIATVYRYFSDLESILVELDIRFQKFTILGLKEMTVAGVFTDDRWGWVSQMMDVATALRTDTPGAIGIARDGYAIPRVREITKAAEDAVARILAVGMGLRHPGLKAEDDWYDMFLLMVRMTSRILDDACAERPADLKQVELLKQISYSFFVPLLDD